MLKYNHKVNKNFINDSSSGRSKENKMTEFIVTENNKIEVLKQIEKETSGMKEIARGFGYELVYPFFKVYGNAKPFFQGAFKPLEDVNEYLPNIRFDDNNKVVIQTTSFGSLDSDEYEKFVDAISRARNFAKEIEDWIKAEKFPLLKIEY